VAVALILLLWHLWHFPLKLVALLPQTLPQVSPTATDFHKVFVAAAAAMKFLCAAIEGRKSGTSGLSAATIPTVPYSILKVLAKQTLDSSISRSLGEMWSFWTTFWTIF
jgi:hypothetical protein